MTVSFEASHHGSITSSAELEIIFTEILIVLKNLQNSISKGFNTMAVTLADITATLATEQGLLTNLVNLTATLHTELVAALAAQDPTALQAVSDSLGALVTATQAAIAANPDPTPAPVEAPVTPPATA